MINNIIYIAKKRVGNGFNIVKKGGESAIYFAKPHPDDNDKIFIRKIQNGADIMRKSLIITMILTTTIVFLTGTSVFSEDLNYEQGLLLNIDSNIQSNHHFYWKSSNETLLDFDILKENIHSPKMVDYYDKYKNEFNIEGIKAEIKIKKFVSFYADKKLAKEQWLILSTNIFEDFNTETYFYARSDQTAPDNIPVILGIQTTKDFLKTQFTGKFDYICNLNSLERKGQFNLHLSSKYEVGRKWLSNIELGFSMFGKSGENYKNKDIFPDNNIKLSDLVPENISIANAKFNCQPFKNMKLSLNYYYYSLQSDGFGRFSNYERNFSQDLIFGRNNNPKSELNLTADFTTENGISSSLLAGWYKPENTYAESPGDDNVFEIRGEIVVSF